MKSEGAGNLVQWHAAPGTVNFLGGIFHPFNRFGRACRAANSSLWLKSLALACRGDMSNRAACRWRKHDITIDWFKISPTGGAAISSPMTVFSGQSYVLNKMMFGYFKVSVSATEGQHMKWPQIKLAWRTKRAFPCPTLTALWRRGYSRLTKVPSKRPPRESKTKERSWQCSQ